MIEKCQASSIRCTDQQMAAVREVFPCADVAFPCRYLGIPLSLKRLRRSDEQPLIDAVAARIPTWKDGLLTQAGRVLLTKVTLSSIPVHLSIACCLSAWALHQIDKRRRAFLWAGTEEVTGGKCKIAWPRVCRPTAFGGLGIVDLRFFGYALRLRWEWLRRAAPGSCWAALPQKTERCVAAMANTSLSVVVGDGTSARFWTDRWLPSGVLSGIAPQLFAAVSRAGKARCVRDALSDNQWGYDVEGARTTQVITQSLLVWRLVQDVALDTVTPDHFVWKWAADGTFSVSSTYRAFFAGATKLLGAKELWRTKAPPKTKLFFWIALHRRLWTADRRKRHHLQDDDACIFCDQAPETGAHLFLHCPFSKQVWFRLLEPVGLTALVPHGDDGLASWWISQRRRLDKSARPPFDSLMLLLSWTLWKERNNRTFERQSRNVVQVCAAVLQEAQDWVRAGYKTLSDVCPVWSQNFTIM